MHPRGERVSTCKGSSLAERRRVRTCRGGVQLNVKCRGEIQTNVKCRGEVQTNVKRRGDVQTNVKCRGDVQIHVKGRTKHVNKMPRGRTNECEMPRGYTNAEGAGVVAVRFCVWRGDVNGCGGWCAWWWSLCMVRWPVRVGLGLGSAPR